MDRNRYEELKKLDYSNYEQNIIQFFKDNHLDDDETDFGDITYYSFMSFMIWLLKTEGRELSVDELSSMIHHENFISVGADELIYCMKDSPELLENVLSFSRKCSLDEVEAFLIFVKPEYEQPYPEQISVLANELLEISEDDEIAIFELQSYQYWIEKLIDTKVKHINICINGYTELTILFYRMNVLGIKNVSFYWDEDYEELVADKMFVHNPMKSLDIGFSAHPYEILERLGNFPKGVSSSWDEIGRALSYVRENGKTVTTINGGSLTDKYSEEVRKFLVENGYLEGVIVLPEKMYMDTWVSPYLMILSQGNKSVKFLDARDYYTKSRNKGKRINLISDEQIMHLVSDYKNDLVGIEIDNATIIENNSILSPIRYMPKSLDSANTISLESVITNISRGISFTGAEIDDLVLDEETRYKCLLPACLGDGVIQKCAYVGGDVYFSHRKNWAKKGDILLTKSGNPFKAAVCNDTHVVIGNVYIISINESVISPYYIKCFFESEVGQAEILKFSTGAKTPIISIENLKNIRIPMPLDDDKGELEESAEEYTRMLEEAYQKIVDTKYLMNSLFE